MTGSHHDTTSTMIKMLAAGVVLSFLATMPAADPPTLPSLPLRFSATVEANINNKRYTVRPTSPLFQIDTSI